MTRFGWVMTTYFSVVGIGATALFHPAPRLIWNASASVPKRRVRPRHSA